MKSESHSVSHVRPFATVHGILQTRILEWVAFPFSRASSQPRDQTQVSHIAGGFFINWAVNLCDQWPLNANVSKPFFEGRESLSLILEITNNIKF